MRQLVVLFLEAVIIQSTALAVTINVPGDYTLIQQAIGFSSFGDTVLVAPGNYSENIDFSGKGITVLSSDGPDVTIIDAGGTGSVVCFTSGEDNSSVIEGFTLRNGTGTYISPYYYGGGINCTGTSPIIRNNIIMENSGLCGGGILCYMGGCPRIEYNTIEENSAENYGAGIYITSSSADVIGNILQSNNAGIGGGGITVAYNSSCSAISNLVVGNSGTRGAGLYCLINGSLTVSNCTVTNNTAPVSGGGLYSYNSIFTIENSIFWENTAPAGEQCHIYSGTGNFNYSCFQGGEEAVLVEGSINWLEGMIDSHPLFESGLLSEYHLSDNSPCIDSGNPSPSYNDTEDPGNPGFALWPAMGTVCCDMGAYGGSLSGGWVSVEGAEAPVYPSSVNLVPLCNPSIGVVELCCNLDECSTACLTVYDVSGRQVCSEIVTESGSLTIDLSDVVPGIYLIKLDTRFNSACTKVMLLR